MAANQFSEFEEVRLPQTWIKQLMPLVLKRIQLKGMIIKKDKLIFVKISTGHSDQE